MEKIYFQEGDVVETLWGEKVDGTIFRVKNLPFHIYGISYDDLIETEIVDDQLRFKAVSKKSGHSTYRVFLLNEKSFQESWQPIESLGCTFEQATKSLYAIDVPENSDINQVYSFLQKAEDAKIWEFEEANFEHNITK